MMLVPASAIQAIYIAVVHTETAAFDKPEPEPFIKPVRTDIVGTRVNNYSFYTSIGKAAGQGKFHHLRPVSLPKVGRFANPDVDRTKICRCITPITALFAGRINYLDKAYGAAIKLRHQLLPPVREVVEFSLPCPVIIRVRIDHMGLFVPVS